MAIEAQFVISADAAQSIAAALESVAVEESKDVSIVLTTGPVVGGAARIGYGGKVIISWNESDQTTDLLVFAGKTGHEVKLLALEFSTAPVRSIATLRMLADKCRNEDEVNFFGFQEGFVFTVATNKQLMDAGVVEVEYDDEF